MIVQGARVFRIFPDVRILLIQKVPDAEATSDKCIQINYDNRKRNIDLRILRM